MVKADVSDCFYRIRLCPADAPKTGLIFRIDDGNKPLVAIHLSIPMGWENSPPLFCTVTETVMNLSN